MKKFSVVFIFLFVNLLFTNSSCQQSKKSSDVVQNVNTGDFKSVIEKKEGVLVDVRTPQEYAEGHIPGALNIDFKSENFKQEIEKLDKSKQYNVYCRSGKRSGEASLMMKDVGFTKVVNLEGGILGWQEKGYEVEK